MDIPLEWIKSPAKPLGVWFNAIEKQLQQELGEGWSHTWKLVAISVSETTNTLSSDIEPPGFCQYILPEAFLLKQSSP